jgi:cytoskeletal protein RodZ
MITVGEILREKRLKKNLSFEEIEKQTKIRVKYLKALEENEFKKLPPAPFVKGFIRNYAKFLKLDHQNLLAILRRDYDEDKLGHIIPRSLIEPPASSKLIWTPQLTIITSFVFVFILFSFYLGRQYLSFISPPSLSIKSPKKDEKVNQKEILVSGKTDQENTLTINGQIVTLSENGEFEKNITLHEGTNNIVIESTKKNGKKTTLNLPLLVELPK